MDQNTPLKLQVLTDDGYPYVGFCKTKLAALGSLRRQLGQYAMRRVFYLPEDITAIITSCDVCDIITIMGGAPRGFLFHPRCGQILLGYAAQNHEYYVEGHGWDFDGNEVPTSDHFPLYDNDHCTRLISTAKREGPWKYKVRTPENYGNVDWKGDAPGVKKSEIPVLTWRGSASRYWGRGSGYQVYQNGEVLFQVGLEVYGAALTRDSDGKVWQMYITTAGNSILVYAQPYKSDDSASYDADAHPNGWRLLTQYQASDPQVDVCVFNTFLFNGSGTEASSCVTRVTTWVDNQPVTFDRFNYYTVTIDIDQKTATIVETSEDDNVEEESVATDEPPDPPTEDWRDPTTNEPVYPTAPMSFFFVGTSTRVCQPFMRASKTRTISAVAIDYVGDTKVMMSMETSRETSVEGNVSENSEFHKVTLQNGYKIEGSGSDNNSCTTIIKETTTLKLNGNDYILTDYDYTNPASTTAEYESYQGYDVMITGYYIDNSSYISESHSERNLNYLYSSIVFADIRNDIIVTLSVEREMSQTRDQVISYNDIDDPYTNEITNSPTTDDIIAAELKIYGEMDSVLNFFEDTKAFDSYIGTPTMPGHTFSYFNGTLEAWIEEFDKYGASAILITGGATGSFAVDVYGNHFYSIVYDTGVFSHLTGCDNVAELTQTPDPNQAYHPIAPL